MPAQIRPTRLEVSDRFPMLGFSIRAEGPPQRAEVAIGSEPGLFGADGKARRTSSNFYSTRAIGPLPIARGEAVFVVPPDVLARFIGNEKLYFGLATEDEGDAATMHVAVTPTSASPYVSLKGLTGRSMQRVRVLPNRQQRASGYANVAQEALEWAGDDATPGMEPVRTNGGAQTTNGTNGNGGKSGGVATKAPEQVPYDDGFGPMPPKTSAPVLAPAPTQSTPSTLPAAQARALIIDSDDVANGQMAKAWLDLIRHDVQPEITATLAARGMQVQKLADAVGTFSFDRYDIRIDTLPTVDGTQLDASALVDYVRLHLNDFVDHAASTFAPYDSGVDDVQWGSSTPAGAVFSIDIGGYPGVDDAAVVGSYVDSTRWRFTTVRTPRTGDHPVSGTREFGLRTDDGAMVLYTRGVDRITNIAEDIGARFVFKGQDALWQSFQAGVARFVKQKGGAATILAPVVKHMNWSVIPLLYSLQSETLGLRRARATALDAGESFTLNWDEVESIPQPTDVSCWAAAAAMVIGWRDQMSLSAETIGEITGRSTKAGLYADDNQAFAKEMGLVAAGAQSYTFEGFRQLLSSSGPLWVSKNAVPNLHAVVVTGLYADGTDNYVRITDPWDRVVGTPGMPGTYKDTHITGSRYIMKWADFATEYEAALSGEPNINLQILHSGRTNGRAPNKGPSTPPGYAQSRALSNESFTINWDEVELVAQTSDVTCWAASAAMVVGWKDRVSLSVDAVTEIAQRSDATGLNPSDVEAFARDMKLTFEYPASYSVDGFRTLLTNHGPLWVGAAVPSLHVIVVTGLYSDGTDTFVRISDPWDRTVGTPGAPGVYLATHTTGSRYIMKWEDFVAEYERAATTYASVNLQILHSGSIKGRTPNTSSRTPAGYAMSTRAKGVRPALGRYPTNALEARTLEADQPRTIGSDGGIEWDLMQYPGMLRSSSIVAATGTLDGEPITLGDWPHVDDDDGGRTQAAVTIGWKFDASGAVGAVRVAPGVGRTSPPRTLKLTGTVQECGGSLTYASLQVVIRYVFRHPTEGEQVAVTTVTLNGDGTHTKSGNWVSPARVAA